MRVMQTYKKKFYIIPIVICALAMAGVFVYYLTGSFSKSEQCEYIYIDDDDNLDSVTAKMAPIASGRLYSASSYCLSIRATQKKSGADDMPSYQKKEQSVYCASLRTDTRSQ